MLLLSNLYRVTQPVFIIPTKVIVGNNSNYIGTAYFKPIPLVGTCDSRDKK